MKLLLGQMLKTKHSKLYSISSGQFTLVSNKYKVRKTQLLRECRYTKLNQRNPCKIQDGESFYPHLLTVLLSSIVFSAATGGCKLHYNSLYFQINISSSCIPQLNLSFLFFLSLHLFSPLLSHSLSIALNCSFCLSHPPFALPVSL